MGMTRKDYRVIAAVIKASDLSQDDKNKLAKDLAIALNWHANNFDPERFYIACTGYDLQGVRVYAKM